MNWGIIGLGKIAHKFAADLQHVPNAKLHAVAASDGQRAKQFAQKYNVPYSFGSYEAMLNCPHLDVVYNATTNEKIRLDYAGWGYRFEAEHVQQCLKKNASERPIVSAAYSLELVGLMDSIREKMGLKYAVDK